MRIAIAGGTGFLGYPLTRALMADGHDVVILTRRTTHARVAPGARPVGWDPSAQAGPWSKEIETVDAVINLAGESIAARRWTPTHKQRILDSRVIATRSLVAAIAAARRPPRVFVSSSAVGYYGPCGDEIVTEEHAAGSDFLATVCDRWESEARVASSATRVACLRTGLVLARDGAPLAPMLLPFKMGVGGPFGSGHQYWPWIHRDDWVALVRWAIDHEAAEGAINLTAPMPVTNREFARTLGKALGRPAFMRAPAFALRVVLGEMADALLLSGQRAVPARATNLGFVFRYTRLPDALGAIFER
jgi:hypothetical protein